MAQRLGVSRMLVHRVWQRFDVQPHRVERFKLSNDPHFDDNVRDVVGLYLDPPDQALVLCVDEKSQIQALDRTRPILPLRPGQRPGVTIPPERPARWLPGFRERDLSGVLPEIVLLILRYSARGDDANALLAFRIGDERQDVAFSHADRHEKFLAIVFTIIKPFERERVFENRLRQVETHTVSSQVGRGLRAVSFKLQFHGTTGNQ